MIENLDPSPNLNSQAISQPVKTELAAEKTLGLGATETPLHQTVYAQGIKTETCD